MFLYSNLCHSLILLHFLAYSLPKVDSSREGELINFFLRDYNKLARPVKNYSNILNATLYFELTSLLSVNEKLQLIKTSFLLGIYWKDLHFSWDPTEYDNITSIRLPISNIWYPDLTLYNSGDEFSNIYDDKTSVAVVDSVGEAFIYVPIILTSTCSIDVTWFPFDELMCNLTFGSWTYSGSEVALNVIGTVNLENYLEDGELELLQAKAHRIEKFYPQTPGVPYYTRNFCLRIKRKILYYFFNLIVPSALIGFLAFLGFTLPPDSGDKLTLGVTLLFSLIMFSNNISQSMPSSADSVPLLGTYFTCIMVTIASSVISTIIINLNLNSITSPKGLSGSKQKLILEWIPKLIRMTPPNNPSVKKSNLIDKNSLGVFEKTLCKNCLSKMEEEKVISQWKYAALVVDRISLIFSIGFTFMASSFLLFNSYTK